MPFGVSDGTLRHCPSRRLNRRSWDRRLAKAYLTFMAECCRDPQE